MSRLIVLVMMAFMFVSVLPSHADIGLGVKIGTPGVGIDLTKDITRTLNARAGVNFFSYGMSDEDDGDEGEAATEIELDLFLMTVPLLLDWHPSAGGFRLSCGIVFNGNKLELTATPGDTVEINDEEYQISSLNGEATFNSLAPYLGIGWGNSSEKESGRWHFSFDLGVMFQGEPDIRLSATASDPAQQSMLDADLESEIDEIEDDASVFNIYPVLAFGVSYTF